jgi:hypothetical protein
MRSKEKQLPAALEKANTKATMLPRLLMKNPPKARHEGLNV